MSAPGLVTVANYNIHMGTDGWSRPFDLAGEVKALDADLLVLQECWRQDGEAEGTAERLAAALGYSVVEQVTLARGKRYLPDPTADHRWGPRFGQMAHALHLDGERLRTRRPPRASVHGEWGIALLSRVPVIRSRVIPLPPLPRDPAARVLLSATVPFGEGELTVCGTHMSHLTFGSLRHYRQLRTLLTPRDQPAALLGDMNLWGPPVTAFLPGWRRVHRQATWPTHRPHSQLDHILVTDAVDVRRAWVPPSAGSDHRPIVAELVPAPASTGRR